MKRTFLILIILSGLLFFFNLGSFSLYDADETFYGEITREILQTGDWLTMHYNQEIRFDKPPLYFWLSALTSFVFGFNEFALRFWAALSGVFTVLVTYYLGRSFYNQRVGFFSGIIAMTSFQFLVQSRIAVMDTMLVFLLTLAMLLFYLGYKHKNKVYFLLFYIAVTLSILAKGPLGLALPVTAILLFLAFKREIHLLREMQIIQGLLILFLIAGPWYAAEFFLYGQRFFNFVFGFLFTSRFSTAVCSHTGPWYYYFFVLLLGFAPWSHFLPYSLWRTWKSKLNSPELLSLCYVIPAFIVFSIAKTKLPNYVLPLYPFLAISVAKLWDDFLGEDQPNMRIGMAIANLIFAVIVVLIIIGFIILGTSNYSGPYQQEISKLLLLAGILIAGSLISIILYLLGKYRSSFYSIPVMVFIIALVLTTQTLPALEKYKGTKELGNKVTQVIKKDELIAAYNIGNRPGVVFYNSKPVVFLETREQALDFLKQKMGYCFTTLAEYENFKEASEVLGKQGDLVVLY